MIDINSIIRYINWLNGHPDQEMSDVIYGSNVDLPELQDTRSKLTLLENENKKLKHDYFIQKASWFDDVPTDVFSDDVRFNKSEWDIHEKCMIISKHYKELARKYGDE